jgi:starvation-inducible DNA-binding protein
MSDLHEGGSGYEALRTRPRAMDELEDTPVGLSGAARRAVIDALQPVLADHLTLYLLYKKHHWTVAGPLFRELHLLFDDHASAVLAASDPIAERIVTLGGTPVAGPSQLIEYSGVQEAPPSALSPGEMLEALIRANEGVIRRLREAISVADDHGDPGTSDLLTGPPALREREKEAWFLSAHLQEVRPAR